jgi:hypothetical protein
MPEPADRDAIFVSDWRPLAYPFAMRLCLPLLLLASLACGAPNRTAGPSGTAGPNYSMSPCVDNCGGDSTCVSHCTDLTGPTGPATPPLR